LTHNLVVDYYRTRRDTTPLSSIVATPFEPADQRNAFHQTLDADELVGAISKLTSEQRQVICLKFIEGYENSEIASMLDKNESAIRALQYRALHSLMCILAAEEEPSLQFALGA